MSHPTTPSGPAYPPPPILPTRPRGNYPRALVNHPPHGIHTTITAHSSRCCSSVLTVPAFVTREDEAAKKAEAARKKAERDALLAEEEKNTPGRSAPKNAKSAQKKTRGLDLDALDFGESGDKKLATLNASGLDNALDALDITSSDSKLKVDRHPEKRVAPAYEAWKERRMAELTKEGYFKIKGNKRSKKLEELWDEFKQSPENPMNQVHGTYDMTQQDIAEIRDQEKQKTEKLLAEA